MSFALYQERLAWFDRQIRASRFPNARHLAERFEVSRRTAKRLITFMRDRLRAPLVYDHNRRGYAYEDSAFELPRIPVVQEELLAVLMARRLLSGTAGGFISNAIRRFGEKLMADTAELGLSPDRLQEGFSATWHGCSPVSAQVFQTVCSGLFQSEDHIPVVLRFTPHRARWIREQVWHEDQQMEELPDGGVRLAFPVADFREVKMMILGFGADVVVESPAALRREIVDEIAKMAGFMSLIKNEAGWLFWRRRLFSKKSEKKLDVGRILSPWVWYACIPELRRFKQ
jgi:predicted DNA-binding transcriptional regulator YafY